VPSSWKLGKSARFLSLLVFFSLDKAQKQCCTEFATHDGHKWTGLFCPCNLKKKLRSKRGEALFFFETERGSTFITLLDGNVPSSSDFLYVSKKWFATRSKKLCMFSIVVVFGHSPSLLIHIPKGRPQYVAQQLRSLLPFAVFRILNPTIDARLLLVCYGATPPSRSSACTGRNPSGRGCARINSRRRGASILLPQLLFPGCLRARPPCLMPWRRPQA